MTEFNHCTTHSQEFAPTALIMFVSDQIVLGTITADNQSTVLTGARDNCGDLPEAHVLTLIRYDDCSIECLTTQKAGAHEFNLTGFLQFFIAFRFASDLGTDCHVWRLVCRQFLFLGARKESHVPGLNSASDNDDSIILGNIGKNLLQCKIQCQERLTRTRASVENVGIRVLVAIKEICLGIGHRRNLADVPITNTTTPGTG